MRNGVLSYRLLQYTRRLIAGCCVGKGSGAVQRAPQTIQQPTDGPRTKHMRVCPRAKHVMIFLFWMGTSNAAEYHDAGLVAASAWTSRAGAAPCGMIAPILVLGVLIFAPRNMRRCKSVWRRNWATHPRAFAPSCKHSFKMLRSKLGKAIADAAARNDAHTDADRVSMEERQWLERCCPGTIKERRAKQRLAKTAGVLVACSPGGGPLGVAC